MRKPIILLSLIALLLPSGSFAIANIDQNALYNDSIYYLENEDAIPDCPTGGAGTTLSGSDHVTAIYNFFTGNGLSPEQASGVLGNMIWESGLGPQRLQNTGVNDITPYDSVTVPWPDDGYGIVQWTPHTKLGDWAKPLNKDPNSLAVQLDFLWSELSPSSPGLTMVKATNTPEAAAEAFMNGFEHPDARTSHLDMRILFAIAVHDYMVNHVPLPPNVANQISTTPIVGGVTSSSGSSCSSSPGTPGVYKNPYRDIKNFWVSRIDGGVDAGGDPGPIYAIGNAVITVVTPPYNQYTGQYDTSWQKIIYKLTDGPAAGKLIYFSEDCKPVVKVGDTVTADTKICDYRNEGLNTEIGWGGSNFGFRVEWIDGPNPPTGFASNSGINFNKFLMTLGLPSAHPDGVSGVSTGSPPPGWPTW